MNLYHSSVNLLIAAAYFTIPLSAVRHGYRLSGRLRAPVGVLSAFILSCGVGHGLEGLELFEAALRWHLVTAVISWIAAIYFAYNLPKLLDFLDLGSRILRHVPSGIGVFNDSIAPDGVRDLLWEARSEYALHDLGFDPTESPTWLGVKQPGHREGLLAEYLAVLDTGVPIINRELYYDDPIAITEGYFLQDVVRLSKDRLLITWVNISSLKAAQAELAHKAKTDPLTGLANRYALQGLNTERFAGALYIDLDRFKAVNDTLGHDVGDKLLCEVTKRFSLLLPDSDFVARIGGDEFFILLEQPDTLDALAQKAKTLLTELQRPYWIGQRELRLDASIGVVDRSAGNLEQMLVAADIAMYTAKQDGGCVRVWDEALLAQRVRNEQILLELQNTRSRYDTEFELHYQPIVDLVNPEIIVGCEALLRWRSAELGRVSPGDFIPIAEESGEISRISKWVIEQAAKQAALWGSTRVISVNVSPWDLEKENFVLELQQACLRNRIPITCLALEITERAVSGNLKYYESVLRELTALQVALKIDDFGTGDSSLKRLLETPWHTVKIDRSLVPLGKADKDRLAICRAIAHLCADFNIYTIAEGIETAEQLELLRKIDINAGQGYYFARPAPASKINS